MEAENQGVGHALQEFENRDIELFLMNCGNLEIEFSFGLQQLTQYWQEIELRKVGFSFSELGIKERKSAQTPALILPKNDSAKFISAWDAGDAEIEVPTGSIVLMKLSGFMRSEGGLSSYGAGSFARDIRKAFSNERVAGVIIETNSGGGESMAGTIIKSAISEKNKPVIGFAHFAASAAYRALSGADEIIASSESSEFGSIGTMITIDQKMLKKYKKRFSDFYGQGAPGKNEDFRKAIAGDFAGLQNMVDKKTESFQSEIKRDRNLRGQSLEIQKTLDGSMFDAEESKTRGLVDLIGNMNLAVRRVQQLQSLYK